MSANKVLFKIYTKLSKRRTLQLYIVLLTSVLSGISEMFSVGAILPFLSALSDPDKLWSNQYVRKIAISFGVDNADQLILVSVILFVIIISLTVSIRVFNLWLNLKVAAGIGTDLSCQAFKRTISQPYESQLKRKTGELIATNTTQVFRSIEAFNALLYLVTAFMVAIGIIITLLIVDLSLTLAILGLFSLTYGFLIFTSKKEFLFNSKSLENATKMQVRYLQEGYGSVRDVILHNNQDIFVKPFFNADNKMRKLQARNNFLGGYPRLTLEGLGIVILILGGLFLINVQQMERTFIIPLLGTIALGCQRLLPSLQRLYLSWTNIQSRVSDLEALNKLLEQPLLNRPINRKIVPHNLKNHIELNNVKYSYFKNENYAINNLNLKICKGERIGLIGTTGSGKTTVIDLLMGLLPPSSGQVLVDGIDINEPKNYMNLLSWRASIAHVPQMIYLSDTSISENIAFGIPKKEINFQILSDAAKTAQISSFIESLPYKYSTLVGERGVRLSGGQIQRIALARAIYQNASLLVLDEATSALDSETEGKVIKSINNKVSKDTTIIMIAHRISTLEGSDRIIDISSEKKS